MTSTQHSLSGWTGYQAGRAVYRGSHLGRTSFVVAVTATTAAVSAASDGRAENLFRKISGSFPQFF